MGASDTKLRQQVFDLRGEASRAKERVAHLEKERDQLLAECVRLTEELEAAKAAATDARVEAGRIAEAVARRTTPDTGSAPIGEPLRRLADGKASLADALALAEAAWPDRLHVLESARRAARQSDFDRPDDALELLAVLANEYFAGMAKGQGDRAGVTWFGEKFAATESETVKKNENARKLRTFATDGGPVEMLRHLKIGTKPSDAKTLRIHFHWDADNRRIVIGHCGRHLDFK